MIRPHAACVVLLCALPAAAGAEAVWRVLPGGVEAVARGGPVGLGLGCGVEGPALWIETPVEEAGSWRFVVSMGACAADVCLLVPEPEGAIPALVDDLRRGRMALVETAGAAPDEWTLLGEVPLAGSSRAIGQVLAACPFP